MNPAFHFYPILLLSPGRETAADGRFHRHAVIEPPGELTQLSAPLLRNHSFLCVTVELEGRCLAEAPQKHAGRPSKCSHTVGAQGQEGQVHIPTLTIAQKCSQTAAMGVLAPRPEHSAVF